ncbi:DUF4192 family protein [Amycolatopsis sp. NPDC051371]|uniref:DUF4192 family protein n=1 Tax=Amycolatopsis sp. NPDC051371 TaxID=3155800 RepID=UPI003435F773
MRERLQHPINSALTDTGIDLNRPAVALARLDRADTAIRAASEGTLPTDEEAIADLVATFATTPFFDVLITVEDDRLHLGAEYLATHLWRHACDPIASRLATLIAIHAYQRGDGTTARIARNRRSPTAATPNAPPDARPGCRADQVPHAAPADEPRHPPRVARYSGHRQVLTPRLAPAGAEIGVGTTRDGEIRRRSGPVLAFGFTSERGRRAGCLASGSLARLAGTWIARR